MPYFLFTLILIMISIGSVSAQNFSFSQKLYDQYDAFNEEAIKNRRFKHQEVKDLVRELKTGSKFEVSKVGQSVEGRDIFMVKIGEGETKVLLWSQMHGDEPTATMALFDIFNFFKQESAFEKEKKDILDNTTLYFIPMLNPDGAEVYQRRNALDIDLNRDALRLQSPESNILKSIRDSLNADFGFNLHDQDILWSAGISGKPATISLLAPAYDYENSVNEVRAKAMKLIVLLNEMLQQYIPGQVAKWSDDFEPRAFGDNIQKWGTSTILIESGGFKNDPEKQQIRKLNFVTILTALKAIADSSFTDKKLDEYYQIPENEKYLFDLVIRNVTMEKNGLQYKVDIGINREEIDIHDHKGFYYQSSIEEIGDMSVYGGYQELDAEGIMLVPGKTYPEKFDDIEDLKNGDIPELLHQGYTTVKVDNPDQDKQFTKLPINMTRNSHDQNEISLGSSANFILQKNGKAIYAIVNGFVYDLEKDENNVKNALVK